MGTEAIHPVWKIDHFEFLKGREIAEHHARWQSSSFYCSDCGLPVNASSHKTKEECDKLKKHFGLLA